MVRKGGLAPLRQGLVNESGVKPFLYHEVMRFKRYAFTSCSSECERL